MSDPQRPKKRKIHDDLEGPQSHEAAPFHNQSLLSVNSFTPWMQLTDEQIEHDQGYPTTPPVPHVEEPRYQTLAAPSEGLEQDEPDLSTLMTGFTTLNPIISNINENQINDPVLCGWLSDGDNMGDGQGANDPQQYDMGVEYSNYYPSYPENPNFSSQYSSHDNLAAYDQPGPSNSSYSYAQQPLCNQLPESSQNDGAAPKGTKDRVRDNAGELLPYWKDSVWKSKGWPKLMEGYGEEASTTFPEPPPPSILYERKKNGRKMHPDNELDPYLHLVDQDALTLIEGSNRGNDMIPKNLHHYEQAENEEQKLECAKNLWKEILGRVINNRQSAAIKNRSLVDSEQFTRGAAQICQAIREYRDLLERVINRQIPEHVTRQAMARLEQTVFSRNNQAPSLLESVEGFARSEAKKKPAPRKKTPRGRKRSDR